MKWKEFVGVTFVIFVTAILIITAFLVWLHEIGDDEDIKMDLTIDNYPRVDGSTSAHPLGVLIACKMLDIPYEWESDEFIGTKTIIPSKSIEGKEAEEEYIHDQVIHHGTHSAYVNLINGEADLILVARLPSEDEVELAKDDKIELISKPIALDAFVFILNVTNPVESLTLDQIKDIYTGEITNWSEVGGYSYEINPYQRNENSGSQELMKSLVMKGEPMMNAPDLILHGMMGPINALSYDEYGIGYSVFYYEQYMAPNEGIKLCSIDGITPSKETIRSREYEFTTEVYAVIREDTSKDSSAYHLRDWLLSENGQDLIEESGYNPI